MFPYSVPPPPPPPQAPQWVPPPPPASSHDPLEVPVDWFIDVPTNSTGEVLARTADWDRKFGTRTERAAKADGVWSRLRVFGKPLAIHYLVAEVFKISRCVEIGYSPDQPFSADFGVHEDSEADVMPVYHAVWTEYLISKRNRR